MKEGNLLPGEAEGFHLGNKGWKNQLLISKSKLEDCNKRRNYLNIAWIEYQKTLCSVPHSWIAKSMELTGVNSKIVEFCKLFMEKFRKNTVQSKRGIDAIRAHNDK